MSPYPTPSHPNTPQLSWTQPALPILFRTEPGIGPEGNMGTGAPQPNLMPLAFQPRLGDVFSQPLPAAAAAAAAVSKASLVAMLL